MVFDFEDVGHVGATLVRPHIAGFGALVPVDDHDMENPRLEHFEHGGFCYCPETTRDGFQDVRGGDVLIIGLV